MLYVTSRMRSALHYHLIVLHLITILFCAQFRPYTAVTKQFVSRSLSHQNVIVTLILPTQPLSQNCYKFLSAIYVFLFAEMETCLHVMLQNLLSYTYAPDVRHQTYTSRYLTSLLISRNVNSSGISLLYDVPRKTGPTLSLSTNLRI
jgi:hypothetical protein